MGQLDYDPDDGRLLPYISRSPQALEGVFTCPADAPPRLTGNLEVTLAGTWDGQVHPDLTLPARNFSYTFTERLMVTLPGVVKLFRIVSSDRKILVLEEELPWRLHDEPLLQNDLSNPITWTYILTKRHGGMANEGFADGHVELMGPADFPATLDSPAGRQAYATHVVLTSNDWMGRP